MFIVMIILTLLISLNLMTQWTRPANAIVELEEHKMHGNVLSECLMHVEANTHGWFLVSTSHAPTGYIHVHDHDQQRRLSCSGGS